MLWVLFLHPHLGHVYEGGARYPNVFVYLQSVAEVSALVVSDLILVSRGDPRVN